MDDSINIISFDDITSGATVRFTVINGVQYLSVRDLIMAGCNTNGNRAMEIWARLPEYVKSEVTAP